MRKRKAVIIMSKSESYKRIMNQRGLKSFKALIEKWDRLSGNLEGRRMGVCS